LDVTLDLSISRDALILIILNQWEDDLLRVDFALRYERTKGAVVEITNDETLIVFLKSDSSVIKIESLATGFSKLKETDVKDWAHISEIFTNDVLFDSVPLDENIPAVKDIIDHAMRDLQYKDQLYGPISDCLEASVREYISAILTAAAMITGHVKLSAEKNITGKRGNGPLDYAMIYKKFFLLITEAKRDQLRVGIVQNLAQLIASREEYLCNLQPKENKRKYMDMAEQIAQVPSTGIVSTGKEWVLIRYVLLPEPTVTKSATLFLPLEAAPSAEVLRIHVIALISKILGAIQLQKDAIDSTAYTKVQRLD
jgi:hypothetical protein